jgi:hypothetical protein
LKRIELGSQSEPGANHRANGKPGMLVSLDIETLLASPVTFVCRLPGDEGLCNPPAFPLALATTFQLELPRLRRRSGPPLPIPCRSLPTPSHSVRLGRSGLTCTAWRPVLSCPCHGAFLSLALHRCPCSGSGCGAYPLPAYDPDPRRAFPRPSRQARAFCWRTTWATAPSGGCAALARPGWGPAGAGRATAPAGAGAGHVLQSGASKSARNSEAMGLELELDARLRGCVAAAGCDFLSSGSARLLLAIRVPATLLALISVSLSVVAAKRVGG